MTHIRSKQAKIKHKVWINRRIDKALNNTTYTGNGSRVRTQLIDTGGPLD